MIFIYSLFHFLHSQVYHKIPIMSTGLIFVPKDFLLGLCLFLGELIFRRGGGGGGGLIIGENFSFQNGLDLTIKTA